MYSDKVMEHFKNPKNTGEIPDADGAVGALGSLVGFLIAIWMLFEKFARGIKVMDEHGPLLVFAAVLIVAGVQLIALGLLGELQVRHFHEPAKRAPYTVDRVLRSSHSQSALAD